MQEVSVKIDHLSAKGRGIGYYNQSKVEVVSGLPGDEVLVALGRKRKGTHVSFFRELLQPSPLRVIPRCKHAPQCGGCSLQQMDYAAQLDAKQKQLAKIFAPHHVERIIPCDSPWAYRNKMEFSFSQNKAGEHFLGLMLAQGKSRVLNLEECHLTAPWFTEVLLAVRTWWQTSGLKAYHPPSNEGSLRTLIVREGQRTGEKLVMLTVSGNPDFAMPKSTIESFVRTILEVIPGLPSIFLRIQQIAKGSATQFYEIQLHGSAHLTERLDLPDRSLSFKISPSSFFQPNTLQAEKLYTKALEMVSLSPQSQVLDLYCGTATIGMAMSLRAGKVLGIELNPYAVWDARANAELNQISNIEILRGDVGALLPELTLKPDLVVLDPPREGLTPQAIQHVLALRPKEILYISCNPKTQAENIAQLTGYELIQLQPVDQFPHTVHVENIALLRS